MIETRKIALWGGIGLMALSVILIFGGYMGVRTKLDVAAQIPYIVSGGLGGVLAAMGARACLAWYFRASQDLDAANLAERLSALEEKVGSTLDLLEAALMAEAGAADFAVDGQAEPGSSRARNSRRGR